MHDTLYIHIHTYAYANFNSFVNLTNIQVVLSRTWPMDIVSPSTSATRSTSRACKRDFIFVGIHVILWPSKMGKYRVRHKNGRRSFFCKIYHKLFPWVILNRRLRTLSDTTTMSRLEWILMINYICYRVWTGIFMIDDHVSRTGSKVASMRKNVS